MSASNRNIKYACTKCGAPVGRAGLTVKRIQYLTMGLKGKLLRSRTVEWLCDGCRDKDEPWSAESRTSSPGFADLKVVQDGSA